MKIRPCALIIENSHVLLLHYQYGNQDVYALPGGNPDPGETLPQTLVRELSEELRIEVEVREMLMLGEVLQSPLRPDVLHCVFAADIIAGIPALDPKHTTALEAIWQPIATLSQLNLYPNVGKAIQNMQGGYLGPIQQPFFE